MNIKFKGHSTTDREVELSQQELYDIVVDWWDDVFVAASYKGKDASLIDLVNAIIEHNQKQKQQ